MLCPSDVSQLPYLDDDPRDMCLSPAEPKIVWTLLLNGILLGFDPETRERVARVCKIIMNNNCLSLVTFVVCCFTLDLFVCLFVYLFFFVCPFQIQVPDIDTHSFCSCFTVWKDFLWVGTNQGMIAIMSIQGHSCVKKIPFHGLEKKQVEIKCVAVSSEEEVSQCYY